MIGERTRLLFKIWGVGDLSPRARSLRTMDSYCSHIDKCVPSQLDVTYNHGFVLPSAALREIRDKIDEIVAGRTGDARSALVAMIDFLTWLFVGGKSGVDSVTLLAELKAHTSYKFLNSYDALFSELEIGLDSFIAYSMRPDVSYFASGQQAVICWNDLKERLLNHGHLVVRREHPLFSLFYKEVFNNDTVAGDKDGNTEPIHALSAATGVTTRANDASSKVLVNYKLSHIYARPNNPLMFTGLYNMAFTPSIVDDFTEETQGFCGIEFRRSFRQFAHDRFGVVYEQFKQFTEEWEIHQRIDAFNPEGVAEKSLNIFRQLAHSDWSLTFEIPD